MFFGMKSRSCRVNEVKVVSNICFLHFSTKECIQGIEELESFLFPLDAHTLQMLPYRA